jgi:hypothetical protein
MSREITQEIYVALLHEGTDVWRPVEALEIGDGLFRIVSKNLKPDIEAWQFITGEIVRCQEKVFSEGLVCLVATELFMKNFMVIDGAQNSTYDIFGIDKTTFDIVFPSNSDVAFLDEVIAKVKEIELDETSFFNNLYSNKLDKKSIKGLHGVLHFSGSPCNKKYFPTRRELDVSQNKV